MRAAIIQCENPCDFEFERMHFISPVVKLKCYYMRFTISHGHSNYTPAFCDSVRKVIQKPYAHFAKIQAPTLRPRAPPKFVCGWPFMLDTCT